MFLIQLCICRWCQLMIKLCVRSVNCVVNSTSNHCAFIVTGSCQQQIILVDHFVIYFYNQLCIDKALDHTYSTYRSTMSLHVSFF